MSKNLKKNKLQILEDCEYKQLKQFKILLIPIKIRLVFYIKSNYQSNGNLVRVS